VREIDDITAWWWTTFTLYLASGHVFWFHYQSGETATVHSYKDNATVGIVCWLQPQGPRSRAFYSRRNRLLHNEHLLHRTAHESTYYRPPTQQSLLGTTTRCYCRKPPNPTHTHVCVCVCKCVCVCARACAHARVCARVCMSLTFENFNLLLPQPHVCV